VDHLLLLLLCPSQHVLQLDPLVLSLSQKVLQSKGYSEKIVGSNPRNTAKSWHLSYTVMLHELPFW
jgi:hypothetical protein